MPGHGDYPEDERAAVFLEGDSGVSVHPAGEHHGGAGEHPGCRPGPQKSGVGPAGGPASGHQ